MNRVVLLVEPRHSSGDLNSMYLEAIEAEAECAELPVQGILVDTVVHVRQEARDGIVGCLGNSLYTQGGVRVIESLDGIDQVGQFKAEGQIGSETLYTVGLGFTVGVRELG